jgi:hypothetical protein
VLEVGLGKRDAWETIVGLRGSFIFWGVDGGRRAGEGVKEGRLHNSATVKASACYMNDIRSCRGADEQREYPWENQIGHE